MRAQNVEWCDLKKTVQFRPFEQLIHDFGTQLEKFEVGPTRGFQWWKKNKLVDQESRFGIIRNNDDIERTSWWET